MIVNLLDMELYLSHCKENLGDVKSYCCLDLVEEHAQKPGNCLLVNKQDSNIIRNVSRLTTFQYDVHLTLIMYPIFTHLRRLMYPNYSVALLHTVVLL